MSDKLYHVLNKEFFFITDSMCVIPGFVTVLWLVYVLNQDLLLRYGTMCMFV